MKVLCDITPVGGGAYETRAKTGVYRVAENLALGLAQSDKAECYFTVCQNIWQARQYFFEHLRAPRTHWAISEKQVERSRHLARLEGFVARTVARQRSLPFRVARGVAVLYTTQADRYFSRVDDHLLGQMNVYHSAFMPVPAWIKKHRSLARFTTIYDLIPISHPHYFSGQKVPRLLNFIVDSLENIDWVLCISEATRQALLNHNPNLDPDRVRVTHLAAGAAFYPESRAEVLTAVRTRCGIPSESPYFLSVCTLEVRKNLETVIRGFTQLCRQSNRPELRLVLVGNLGWKAENIKAALEEAGEIKKQIIQTGFVPDEDLAALYSGACAFVYLSRIEGFGLPPLEAMQCGTPVITSNVSSLPEVVGDAGILLDPDDRDGLSHQLGLLADDVGGLRATLSNQSLDRSRQFSWQRFTDENFAAYHAALSLA